MKKYINKIVFGAILFCLIIFVLGCTSKEERLYDKARSENKVSAYEHFQKQYPKSQFTDSVNFYIEKIYFTQAKDTNSIDSYIDFLNRYPKSQFTDSVNFYIEKIYFTKIAFDLNRDGNKEIYVMDADGSNQTNLTNNPADDVSPSWSQDGKKITFRSDRDMGKSFSMFGNEEIYVMNADGSEQTNLTNNPADDINPSWSPDGKKITFGSNRDGNGEIYIMNADGSEQTNLTNNLAYDGYPSWSPLLKIEK